MRRILLMNFEDEPFTTTHVHTLVSYARSRCCSCSMTSSLRKLLVLSQVFHKNYALADFIVKTT